MSVQALRGGKAYGPVFVNSEDVPAVQHRQKQTRSGDLAQHSAYVSMGKSKMRMVVVHTVLLS
jgi:hypothetical protein